MTTTTPDFIQNDIGLRLIIQFVLSDEITPRNISLSTTMEILVQKPSESTFTAKTATFTTDGTDGKIEYPWAATDIDEVGHYKARGHAIEPGKNYQTDIAEFVVGD